MNETLVIFANVKVKILGDHQYDGIFDPSRASFSIENRRFSFVCKWESLGLICRKSCIIIQAINHSSEKWNWKLGLLQNRTKQIISIEFHTQFFIILFRFYIRCKKILVVLVWKVVSRDTNIHIAISPFCVSYKWNHIQGMHAIRTVTLNCVLGTRMNIVRMWSFWWIIIHLSFAGRYV